MARYDAQSIERVVAACDDVSSEGEAISAMLAAMCEAFSWSAAVWWDVEADGARRCRSATGSLSVCAVGTTLPPPATVPEPGTTAILTAAEDLPEHLDSTGAGTVAIVATKSGTVIELLALDQANIGSSSRQVLFAAVAIAARARDHVLCPPASSSADNLLPRLVDTLPDARSEAEAISATLQMFAEEKGWPWSCVWRWKSPDEHLHAATFYGDHPAATEATRPIHVVFEEGLVGGAYIEAVPAWAPLATDERSAVAEAAGCTTAVAIPIVRSGSVVAVLEFWAPQAPDESERATLRIAQRLISARVQQLGDDRQITDLAMLPALASLVEEALRAGTDRPWDAAAEPLVDLAWSDVVAFVRVGPDGELVASMPADHLDEISAEALVVGAAESLPVRCFDEGVVLDQSDLGGDAWGHQLAEAGFPAVLCVPIVGQRAALVLLWRSERERDTHLNRVLLETGRVVAALLDGVAAETPVVDEGVVVLREELERLRALDVAEQPPAEVLRGVVESIVEASRIDLDAGQVQREQELADRVGRAARGLCGGVAGAWG
ncbi:MAG: hypothetical protein ACI8S6_004853 [Myxococcota bacterium]|jgi:hypothetical protein